VTSNKITHLVEEFSRLEEARVAVKKEARDAGLDPAALRRAALWNPHNVMKRRVQAAVDHQLRFLSGREPEPAKIPVGSDLEKVAALSAMGKSARDIGAQLGFGKTKANQLTQQAELFGVRKTADADSLAPTPILGRDP
jgi:hypothetical protein